MKLSDFKTNKAKNTLKILKDGTSTFEEIEDIQIDNLEGDILFYELSFQDIEKLQKTLNENSKEDEIAFFIYELIGYITDVERDLNYNEFLGLMMNPSNKFIIFMNKLKEYAESTLAEIANMTKDVLDIAEESELSEIDIYKGEVEKMSFDNLLNELIEVKEEKDKLAIVKSKMLSLTKKD